MISFKGYVEGNSVVADGFIGNIYDGKEVIVTILDSFRSKKKKVAAKKTAKKPVKKTAAKKTTTKKAVKKPAKKAPAKKR